MQDIPREYSIIVSNDYFTRHLNRACIKHLLHNALDASRSHRDCII